ncbi:hypothetical protein MMC25_001902 [Agyrium rufum]|nr:hypothetical protein [Agyrium rufum]
MASSSTADKVSEPESFITMDRDLDSIGAHCQHPYCNQLDFLPFRCESCKNTYCLDHRTENAHTCAKAGAWAAARRKAEESKSPSPAPSQTPSSKPTLATGTQCSHPSCKTFINTLSNVGVSCQTCNRDYCLKHRLREEHACSTLTPLGARTSHSSSLNAQSRGLSALARLKAWSKDTQSSLPKLPKPKPKPTSPAAIAASLNEIKRTAKGDARVPPEKRVYIHVEAEATTTKSKYPKGDMFMNGEWSVGRVLDEAAKGLQVVNVNNRGGGEEEKLRIFHVESGRVLEFGEKLGAGVSNGNTIVLLRGIGAQS